ncbi:hypothetical protein BDD12DRAFT_899765 [Trichophaea hybrida]|nr:hypothetical protein BDD12DRAFT_899765 [Trichophaea hybrida]
MDLEAFANKFLEIFYAQNLFGADASTRPGLSIFYRENSLLTFEEQKFTGVQAITEKYVGLPQMRYQCASRDVQPSAPDGSVLIYIIGQIMYEGTDHPQTFSQVFHLVPEGGQWYILNDIFRFVYVAA